MTTEEEYIKMVSEDGHALQYVEKQTEEICLAAVRQDGLSLEYVENQTPDICRAAVRQDCYAIPFVKLDYSEVGDIQWYKGDDEKNTRDIYMSNFDGVPLFSCGCQINMTKGEFIERIHKDKGGLSKNPHRAHYLEILKNY